MIFPGPFPFQNSAARRLAQWHPTATQLTHLTQRCEDVAVGARMPEPFAKAPVALSHRTASWLPRCRLGNQRKLPKLQPRNSTFPRTWSGEAQPTAILVKTTGDSQSPRWIKDIFKENSRFVISNAPNTRLQNPTHSNCPTSPHSLVGRQRPRPPEN